MLNKVHHNEGDHFIIETVGVDETGRRFTGIRRGVHFVDGSARIKTKGAKGESYEWLAREFETYYDYRVTLPKGYKPWVSLQPEGPETAAETPYLVDNVKVIDVQEPDTKPGEE